MPAASLTERMPCASSEVFELLHDYSRRLEWDTLLREARLTRGHRVAARGATSLCVGRPFFGMVGIETRYLSFTPGVVAAVSMINSVPFFGSFAASIRHKEEEHGSSLTYKFQFTARPRHLRWILEPIMLCYLRHETRRRLTALAGFLRSRTVRRSAPSSA